ncbi:hypothetical protein ACWPMX_14670 [Tsuneonella sp. HG094]|jgi:hypothetical protein
MFMGIARRPKLATRYSGPRAGERDVVSLEGRCRIGDGAEEAVAVLDFDARGCRVRGITTAVVKNAPVLLWLGATGPHPARLRWLKRGSAGLAFEAPLGDDDLAEALRSAVPAVPARVVPLRRRSSTKDA